MNIDLETWIKLIILGLYMFVAMPIMFVKMFQKFCIKREIRK